MVRSQAYSLTGHGGVVQPKKTRELDARVLLPLMFTPSIDRPACGCFGVTSCCSPNRTYPCFQISIFPMLRDRFISTSKYLDTWYGVNPPFRLLSILYRSPQQNYSRTAKSDRCVVIDVFMNPASLALSIT